MIEDAVQAIYRSVSGEKKDVQQVKVWKRVVGWVWVVSVVLVDACLVLSDCDWGEADSF